MRTDTPLPLLELLDDLRARGLQLGIREHLALGRLLDHWDEIDTGTLRTALACILARNVGEVLLVREAFDRRYVLATPGDTTSEETVSADADTPGLLRRIRDSWSQRRVLWALSLLVLVTAVAFFSYRLYRPRASPVPDDPPSPQYTKDSSAAPEPQLPAPPRPIDWKRAAALAGVGGATVFVLLYLARTRKHAISLARQSWRRILDMQPGAQTYDLVLNDLAPAFRADFLDDVASILGRRRSGTRGGDELDVERTLDMTLRAGLAPQIVLESRVSSDAIIMLVDVAPGMAAFRIRTDALIAGLRNRGVPLDVFYFDAQPWRLFRWLDGPSISLRQLQRLHSESPLLILSAGAGLGAGERDGLPEWAVALKTWRSRVWIHPSADRSSWKPAFHRIGMDVWPMSSGGLLAAARELARSDRRMPSIKDALVGVERPVTPLDVDRIRWMLTLAERNDPALAEMLRQTFCPFVPASAVPVALTAPPLKTYPGVGPTEQEVRHYLLEILDGSRPAAGTIAHERWRLDRAVQALSIQDGSGAKPEATREIALLASGPLASEVEDAVGPIAASSPELRETVVNPIRRRAAAEGFSLGRRVRQWGWPRGREIAGFLLVGTILLAASPAFGPIVRDEEPASHWSYRLRVDDPNPGRARAALVVAIPEVLRENRSLAPLRIDLFRGNSVDRTIDLSAATPLRIPLPESERGSWYYVSAGLSSGAVGLSERVEFPQIGRPSRRRLVLISFQDGNGKTVSGVGFRLVNVDGSFDTKGRTPQGAEAVVALNLVPGHYEIETGPTSEFAPLREKFDVDPSDQPLEYSPVLKLKLAAEKARVPNVVGLDVDAALKRLQRDGFLAGKVNASAGTTSDFSNATVTSQNPRAGSTASLGSRVDLKVDARSQPVDQPETVTVPNVVGMRLMQARARLRAAELTVETDAPEGSRLNAPNQSEPVGEVIAQDPPAETEVRRGSVVRLSIGPSREPGLTLVERSSETLNPNWGCEEEKSVDLEYQLRSDEEYVDARVEVTNVDKAKSYNSTEPSYNPKSRRVMGRANFRGLDLVLFNCPGGGHATVRLIVRVRVRSSGAAAGR